MKIAVTGGTGFVGSHAVASLVAAGHEVRLLARRAERVPASLGPLGVDVDDVVVGDATDAGAVGRLLEGCDAVLHGAAVYSYDPRRFAEMAALNLAAAERVLGTAVQRGLDPVVYVSSVTALLDYGVERYTLDSPLGPGTDPYSRTKLEGERFARTLQADGAPVVSVLPGGVIGPEDPYLGEANLAVAETLRGKQPVYPRGASATFVDVRDLGAAIAATFEPGRGPRRYLFAPHTRSIAEIAVIARRMTGRRLPAIPIPDRFALATARIADRLQRVVPFSLPIRESFVRELFAFKPVDDAECWRELGVTPRPLEETLTDTVRWLVRAGHLTPKQAGRLAPDAAPLREAPVG